LDNTQKRKEREEMKTLVLAGLFVTLAAGTVSADILYSQSFEDVSWLGGKYFDLGDADVAHALLNNAGEAAVNVDGLSAWYTPFDTPGVGLTDGDYVGVTTYAPGGTYDGDQHYQMSDTDGIMSLISDEYAGATNVSLAIYIADTGYEDADSLTITMGGVDVFSIGGGDDGGLAMEEASGVWIELNVAVSGGALDISFASNSGSEAVYIDAIVIEGGAIPAPGALALLGLAGIASRRRRK
jgi:MYXO-CTERM domain-containing protein